MEPERSAALSVFDQTISIQLGVDIGKQRDPTALVLVQVLERVAPTDTQPKRTQAHYRVQRLERLELGIDYPRVAQYLVSVLLDLNQFEKRVRKDEYDRRLGRYDLRAVRLPVDVYVDATGVGGPVYDMLVDAVRANPGTDRARLHDIRIKHGDKYDSGTGMLGKQFLVSKMQTLLQEGRVEFSSRFPEVDQLVRELKDYEIKISEDGSDTYGAFRVGTHDDLATALGLACVEDPAASRIEAGPLLWGTAY